MYVFEGAILVKKGITTVAGVNPANQTIYTNGVQFPAAQVSSSDVNTLDDYEEGNWTPVDSSGAGLSLTTSGGVYTKVGRLVTINFGSIIWPATVSGLQVLIGGLPFSPAIGGGWVSGGQPAFNSAPIAGVGLMCQTAIAGLYGYQEDGTSLTNAEMSTAILYGFSMSYMAAT